MARVGILTFHYANNYGAVLQAYGLSKAIKEMGHYVEVLDYCPLAARRSYGRWPRRHPLRIFPFAVKRWRFRQFRQRYLPLSLRTYWTLKDLQSYPPDVDCVICGSDQVWNIASYRGFDPAFFLEFVEEGGPRRISYAATFGFAEELGNYHERIRNLLSGFDYLSVRDRKSQKMLQELTGRPTEHVLDPTFLTDYEPITPPRIYKYPYIFVHCVSVTYGDFFIRTIGALSKRLGMPAICVDHPLPLRKTKFARAAGPLQWLSLIRHAEFVCTSSFHGTCFSLINRKQFVVFPISKGQFRLEDILQTAGLSNRLVCNEDELERSLANPISYSTVSERLEEACLHSKTFLREALK
jgi:hypothetical protein